MNGTASATEWLACGGIGCGAGVVVLGLLKLALDGPPDLTAWRQPDRTPALPAPPPPLPGPKHAAPLLIETQPIRVLVHPARHAKKAA